MSVCAATLLPSATWRTVFDTFVCEYPWLDLCPLATSLTDMHKAGKRFKSADNYGDFFILLCRQIMNGIFTLWVWDPPELLRDWLLRRHYKYRSSVCGGNTRLNLKAHVFIHGNKNSGTWFRWVASETKHWSHALKSFECCQFKWDHYVNSDLCYPCSILVAIRVFPEEEDWISSSCGDRIT
jgi:hypothetical protein